MISIYTERGTALSASDRRILLAHWYFKAVHKALEGDAKRKYFEHAGALLTADGTDDELIKLEAAHQRATNAVHLAYVYMCSTVHVPIGFLSPS